MGPGTEGGYVRTREFDTLRLVCPWQWMKCGRDFKDRPNGKYLGGVNLYSGVGYCMPRDDDLHIFWKSHAGDAAVAEWNWSFEFADGSGN